MPCDKDDAIRPWGRDPDPRRALSISPVRTQLAALGIKTCRPMWEVPSTHGASTPRPRPELALQGYQQESTPRAPNTTEPRGVSGLSQGTRDGVCGQEGELREGRGGWVKAFVPRPQ